MNVQTKILLLLFVIVATLIGGFVGLKVSEERRFQSIALDREEERNRNFDEFLAERGDNLKVLVEDSSTWDEMVRALGQNDATWAGEKFSEDKLAAYKANAIWIYRPDWSLFFSRNNRYAENLDALPVPAQALRTLFATQKVRQFFVQVPQGLMEIRGGTVHPSIDGSRSTPPQGYLFAGHLWIDENLRRMSLFTGYDIHIEPVGTLQSSASSREDLGKITFERVLPGWDGQPVGRIMVQHDSPLIREMNNATERRFIYLLIFAGIVFLVLSISLIFWVRRPLQHLALALQTGNPAILAPLRKTRNEFGQLAELILRFRSTEKALLHAEEQLRHAQKMEAVGRLAGGVAHDFNNLLTAIIGYSELLRMRLGKDATAREFAELILKAGEKAASLTKQLLAFSRRQLLLPQVLDLNALIRDMEKLLQRVIGEHIQIDLEIHATDPRVLADPSQLEQVILNLGVNARDAMPRGGTLTIATENRPSVELGAEPPPRGYVVLTVRDTGSGMDSATKERIFEPFFTTKGPGKGTGLGLATVYGIVKQSGGEIVVESELGKGSEFILYFPCDGGAIVKAEPPPPLELPAQKPGTILVVEDEEVVLQLISAVLSDVGYELLCASCPSEALEIAGSNAGHIDLLLTDVVLPEMHGPELARRISESRPGLRILFVSGYSEADISDQGLDASLDVLQKPFTQQSLMRKVAEMLDQNGA